MEDNHSTLLFYMNEKHDSFNGGMLTDYRKAVNASVNKYLARMDKTEQKGNYLLSETDVLKMRHQRAKGKSIINVNIDKAQKAIDSMENNDDIRIQIQCVTRIIKQLDILYKSGFISSNERKMVVFFRSVLKLNCDKIVFSDKQITEFKKILEFLRSNDSESKNLTVMAEKELRKVGLRTMISWE